MKKSPTKNKKMTIDDLAIIVKKGFDGVNKKFIGIDKRFIGIDKRFAEQDKKIDDKFENFAIMVQRGFREQAENTKSMFNGLEIKVDSLDRSVFNLGQKVDSMDERLKDVEKAVKPLIPTVDLLKINYKNHEARIIKLENFQTK